MIEKNKYGNPYELNENNPYNMNQIANQKYPIDQYFKNQQMFQNQERSSNRQFQNPSNLANQDQSSNPQVIEDYPQTYSLNNDGSLYSNARNGFIRKVYTLLCLQIIFTILVCLWAINTTIFKQIFVNFPMIITLSIALLAVSLVVGIFPSVIKKYGLVFFLFFTVIISLFVGIACATTKPHLVLAAAGITLVLVIVLTTYACFTDTDFTSCLPYLIVFSLVLFSFGVTLIFWRDPVAHLVYACVATLFFGIYLIFDTQQILGKFGSIYTIDDHYIAAIQLYIDIMELFLQILSILSRN